jgi:hypothetical protein
MEEIHDQSEPVKIRLSGLGYQSISFYSDKMTNISKWRSTLYISQVGLCKHVFKLCTCFLNNLVEFHSKK